MRKTFLYRIFPNKKQSLALQAVLDECRWVYNKTLELRKNLWEQDKKSLSLYDTNKFILPWREQRPTLENAYSHTLQNAQERVDLAFQAFFRRVKSGDPNPGFPRFKSYDRYDSFTFKESGFKLEGGKLKVSKVGKLKLVFHRPTEGTIKTLTLRRSSTGKWYACFSCEGVEPKRLPKNAEAVGLDVGLKTFATLSNGQEIANPRFFRQGEKALAKVQRKLSKEAKGTKERRFRRKAVARVHEGIGFKRNNFTHQYSRKIVNQFGTILVEDLRVNRMVKNHRLAKSIADAGWSQFFEMIHAKAVEAGRIFFPVNPAYTSQTCSNCGYRRTGEEKLSLCDRFFDCPHCQLQLDRDLNAALNIKAVGLHRVGQPLEAPAFRRGE